jgi:hypothetical protein
LISALDALIDRQQQQLLGRPLDAREAVICYAKSGAGSGQLVPTRPIAQTVTVQQSRSSLA